MADDLERYRAWRDSLPSSERGPIEEGEKTNVGSRDSRNRYKVKIRQKTKNVYNTTNVVYNVAGGISGQEEKKKSLWQRIKDPKTGEEAKGTFWGIVLSPFRGLAYLIKNFGVPIFAIIIFALVAVIKGGGTQPNEQDKRENAKARHSLINEIFGKGGGESGKPPGTV